MDEVEVGHRWAPIADLTDDDRAVASEELPALARTWAQVRQTLDPQQVDEFNERLKREWAIETGIIERLYSLDRGTTEVLIKHGIDASLIASDATDQPPELVAGIIRDHAEAVDWLFDAVTSERPLSTSFLKHLHQFMTRKQVYATGIDMFGRKHEIELRHGEFKVRPNNPVRPDGKLHEYCPPEHVDAEMDRLIEMHNHHSAAGTAPDVSAAWLHHRFAQIHPFQDGNGRIARAIASLVLIGAGWFPLVVTRDDRSRYISALEQADDRDLSLLIRLVAELQRKWFVRAVSIAEDVRRESLHLEQMLDVIGDMFGAESAPAQSELHKAFVTAEKVWFQSRNRFDELKEQLEQRLGFSDERGVWCDFGRDDDARRRTWNRYQVVDTARSLDYFANTRVLHEWVRLGIQTEHGRSEILTSFHGIGTEFRGLVGVSMCFYRRQQPEDTEDHPEGTPQLTIQQQIIELQPVSEEVFQINYEEPFESVERRFQGWLERALVLALDQWRRGE
ncbi:MAG: Fic family protein [Acidimicrobiia bacterium]|nr:Fic family protein [Acidimicrobiia bacterium]